MSLTKWIRITLSASGASAKNSAYVFGAPPPSAAWGFARHVAITSGVTIVGGAAFILHEYRARGKTKYGEHTYPMPRSTDRDRPGHTQVDMPQSDLSASIVFRVRAETAEGISALEEYIPSKFAKGLIDWARYRVSSHDKLSDALAKVAPGFAMIEHPIEGELTIDSMIEHLAPIKDVHKGWLTPSMLGYRLLEEPLVRDGTRALTPHSYADPLTGIVRWESFYQLRRDCGAGLTFWGPSWISEKTVIFNNQTS